jgi:hypothetical protein
MAFNNSERPPEHYRGRSISRVMRVNNQIVKAVWKEEQLQKYIFPSFERVFRALGFDKVDWWDLLGKVAFGGKIYLKGPKSIEPPSYTSETMDYCLKPQRALAQSLLNQVFNKKDNLAYLRDPTDIGIVGTRIRIHPGPPGAFRGTEVTFRALDLPDNGFYIVTIGGRKGCDTHRFHFEPSISWVCSRFPENCP